MKMVWRKLSRWELLPDFIAFASLICLSGGLMIFLIVKIADKSVVTVWDARFSGIFGAVIFVLIFLAGISFYRLCASHIRRYKTLLDAIPTPIIVTDNRAVWLQANKAARDVMNLERDSDMGEQNSRHLITSNGSIMEKIVTHKGMAYRVLGHRLDEGYVILLDQCESSNIHKTRTELIDEINKLLAQMSTATDQFNHCASSLARYTMWQAGVIHDLSDVIAEIASGELKEPDALNEKIDAFKSNMQQHEKNSKNNLEAVKRAVEEITATRDFIGNVSQDIGNGS